MVTVKRMHPADSKRALEPSGLRNRADWIYNTVYFFVPLDPLTSDQRHLLDLCYLPPTLAVYELLLTYAITVCDIPRRASALICATAFFRVPGDQGLHTWGESLRAGPPHLYIRPLPGDRDPEPFPCTHEPNCLCLYACTHDCRCGLSGLIGATGSSPPTEPTSNPVLPPFAWSPPLSDWQLPDCLRFSDLPNQLLVPDSHP